ncbi:integrase, catalytic region, zinc finger, CCHC-type containing protein [Tanacetum coccineum]|uniref:Integrase, catalytic region, zinc finger, CCHC-type containing protein n=1 Tax=Tanacetum coccineum TaxID=301880 RepID=A0ABQ5BGC0_9ASTR
MYTSWAIRMLLYIKGKEHGRMMFNLVLNGPLVYPTIKVDSVTRLKTYEELSDKEKLQDDCNLHATNIVLQGLPPDIYALVNHNQCKLYNEFDKFASIKGETLYDYYMRFAQLMNDIHIIGMTMQQVQVNTKFLNGLQPEWRKFMIDVKLAKSLGVHRIGGNNAVGQVRVANCQGEGHMARQCTQPKRPRNSAWFKEKLMLTDDLDAFNFDYDEAPGASSVLMAHLSSYDSDVISEVPNSDNYLNDTVSNMCVQEESYSEQLTFNPNPDINITSDSNIISYEQYLQETESAAVQNNTSSDQQNAMIMSVFDTLSNQVAKYTADNLKLKELDEYLTA